jgi:hypothetical protein
MAGADSSESRAGSGKTVFLCGSPREFCSGGLAQLSNGLKGRGLTGHSSPSEAFKCHAKYLIKIGYTQLSSREFRPPDGGPIRILTKQSRFGAKMRPGKGMRSMPSKPRTGFSCSSL